MKKAVIAGFLALVSSLWAIAICAYVELNPVDNWMDFRFLESAVRRGVIFPLALSLIVMTVSIVYLLIALFRKEK